MMMISHDHDQKCYWLDFQEARRSKNITKEET